MSMDFKQNIIRYVIYIVTSCGVEIIELEKGKNPGKDKWETLNFIPLIPLLGVNYFQSILHMSKIIISSVE